MIRAIVAIVGLLALPSTSFAGREIYSCEINERYTVSASGRLRDATKGAAAGTVRGMRFIVVRETGRMQGDAPVGLGADAGPRVLQRGNDEAFYIALYIGKKNNYSNLEAIWVEEFSTERRKPFMAVGAGFVYTGTCE
jgi:hypothetical protein